MSKILIIILAILLCDNEGQLFAQRNNTFPDTVGIPYSKYAQYIYFPELKAHHLSYNYSGLWDLDGDQKKDSLFFIGNGGAHTYFFLRMLLSRDSTIKDFPTVQLDMPYVTVIEVFEKLGKNSAAQFVVHDFDDDNVHELYLNFNNDFGSIPPEWENQGVKSRHVLLDSSGEKPVAKDY